jgi:hypothetical protein
MLAGMWQHDGHYDNDPAAKNDYDDAEWMPA